jgi:hypothetical protein
MKSMNRMRRLTSKGASWWTTTDYTDGTHDSSYCACRVCLMPRHDSIAETSGHKRSAVARLGTAAGALAVSAVCSSAGCHPADIARSQARSIIGREWSQTVPGCTLQSVGNSLGEGLILYCAPSDADTAASPTWLYSNGVAYAVNDSARSATPRIAAMSDATPAAFRMAGLDRGRFQNQVASMIAAQREQSVSR